MRRGPGRGYAGVVLAVATLAVFSALGLARFGYSALLPAMQKGLRLDNREAGLLASANLAGYLLFCVVGGALASRVGARAVIAAGLCVVGVSMAMTGLAESFGSALFWRAWAGVGSGASNVPAMGLMAAWFARERRGAAAGVAVSGSSFALMAVGLGVPPLLTATGEAGWRIGWLVFGTASLVVAAVAYALIRNRPEESPHTETSATDAKPAGLQWSSVYRAGAVWRLGLIYVAFGFAYIIYMTFFVKHLLSEGYAQREAGRLFMLMGVCSLFCGLVWGMVSDRIGRAAALTAVYLIQVTAYAAFAGWRTPTGFVVSAVLFGLTAWSIPAIMAAACGDLLGARLAPAALGFITLFFGLGQALGPYVAGAMGDAFGTLTPAFMLAAVVSLAGAFASHLVLKDRHIRT